jgi:hypothetical protein
MKAGSSHESRLKAMLGSSHATWCALIAALAAEFSPLDSEWKPTKLEFGSVLLLKWRKRTLIYMIPGSSQFEVSVVLGERAVALALTSDLPSRTKRIISEARAYVEGRGVRFSVLSHDQIATVVLLVRLKTSPK